MKRLLAVLLFSVLLLSGCETSSQSAQCQGQLSFLQYDEAKHIFYYQYSFSWDQIPFWKQTDCVHAAWQAINPESYSISCSAVERKAVIQYYGNKSGKLELECEIYPESSLKGISYPVRRVPEAGDTENDFLWAKTGTLTIGLEPDGELATIHAIQTSASVGHVCVLGQPDVTPTSYPNFTYEPIGSVYTVGKTAATIRSDGSFTKYPVEELSPAMNRTSFSLFLRHGFPVLIAAIPPLAIAGSFVFWKKNRNKLDKTTLHITLFSFGIAAVILIIQFSLLYLELMKQTYL